MENNNEQKYIPIWNSAEANNVSQTNQFYTQRPKENFIPVDDWVPEEEDKIFKCPKGSIFLDVSSYYGFDKTTPLDYFSVTEKRCYNNDKLRSHLTHYLNYFVKFYDQDKELQMIYYRLKYIMDYYTDNYSDDNFIYDLQRYIMSPTMMAKIDAMNEDNYNLELNYTNDKNPSLQYNDNHGKIMMKISLIMNMIIPLCVHFIHVKKIYNVNDFLLRIYDIIIHRFGVDIYSKLYDTAVSNVQRNKNNNEVLWDIQDIRGKNVTTHSLYSVENIILNIMPKYCYNQNIVHFNYRSIIQNTKFQITDIGYEYNFVSLSSSARDED